MSGHFPRPRHGLSLIEILVALTVIGLLLGLLFPAVQAAREAVRRTSCRNNQKQIGLAILAYETSHGHLPAGRKGCDDTGEWRNLWACPPGLPSSQKTAASGFVSILSQLDQQSLRDRLSVDQGGLWNRNVDDLQWYTENQGKRWAVQQRLSTLVCPSDTSGEISDVYHPIQAATGSYALVQGSLGPGTPDHIVKYDNDGLFLYVRPRMASEVVDGLSRTLMIGEVVLADTWESSNTWTYAIAHADCLRTAANPLNTFPGQGQMVQRQNGAFASQHSGGAIFCFADGHVEWVDQTIEHQLYQSLSSIRENTADSSQWNSQQPQFNSYKR